MVMLVSPVQSEKVLSPIAVTPSGMIMLVSSVQPEKALSPITVTLFAMVNRLYTLLLLFP